MTWRSQHEKKIIMNRDEFFKYRDNLDLTEDTLRLDSIDPFTNMAFLKKAVNTAPHASAHDVINQWHKMTNMGAYSANILANQGVRATITALFNHFANNQQDLWIAEDNYDFYNNTAKSLNISARYFATLPEPQLSDLSNAASDAVMLISNPVSPLGRYLNDSEIEQIKGWLSESKARRVLLDTVYDYKISPDESTRALLNTDQAYAIGSLSKSYLERGSFGILITPSADIRIAQAILAEPKNEAPQSALPVLASQPNLPHIQQEAFNKEWARLSPAIKNFAPDFKPPLTGYFTMIAQNFETVLKEHNALLIPATLFGSKDKNLSVASCLNNISPKI
jgi:aspartate/methionine/tyrosine aminotransferase